MIVWKTSKKHFVEAISDKKIATSCAHCDTVAVKNALCEMDFVFTTNLRHYNVVSQYHDNVIFVVADCPLSDLVPVTGMHLRYHDLEVLSRNSEKRVPTMSDTKPIAVEALVLYGSHHPCATCILNECKNDQISEDYFEFGIFDNPINKGVNRAVNRLLIR